MEIGFCYAAGDRKMATLEVDLELLKLLVDAMNDHLETITLEEKFYDYIEARIKDIKKLRSIQVLMEEVQNESESV